MRENREIPRPPVRVISGRDYAVPGNDAPSSFLYQVRRLWFRALRRRSQRHRLTWERMGRIATRWLPLGPRDAPLPGGPLRRHIPKVGAQCGNPARWDLCGGRPEPVRAKGRPYRD